jgi:hypothetical protein
VDSEPWTADVGEQKFSILEFNVDRRIQLSNAFSQTKRGCFARWCDNDRNVNRGDHVRGAR